MKEQFYVVDGLSMYPFLNIEDKILVTPLTRPPRFGDIVLAKEDEKVIIHRYLFGRTKGDNLKYYDTQLDVHGMFQGIVKNGRIVKESRFMAVTRGLLSFGNNQRLRFLNRFFGYGLKWLSRKSA